LVRAGYRIFDANTHIIEPLEAVEESLTAAHWAKLGAYGLLVQRAPAQAAPARPALWPEHGQAPAAARADALRGPASTAASRGAVMHGIQLRPPS
jgi:hypothetical protein